MPRSENSVPGIYAARDRALAEGDARAFDLLQVEVDGMEHGPTDDEVADLAAGLGVDP